MDTIHVDDVIDPLGCGIQNGTILMVFGSLSINYLKLRKSIFAVKCILLFYYWAALVTC